MAGKSTSNTDQMQTTNSTSTTNPWAAATPALTGILNSLTGLTSNSGLTSAENNALNTLSSNANDWNTVAARTGDVANQYLTGGTDRTGLVTNAWNQAQSAYSPYLSSDYLDPTKNPTIAAALDTVRNDISNSVNSQFAGAGRDLSGTNQQALARGISQGEASTLLNQYNQNVAAQQNAISGLTSGAQGTANTLSGLDQTRLANMQTGSNLLSTAATAKSYAPLQQLYAESQRRSIPTDYLSTLSNMLVPIAGLGSTTTNTGTSYGKSTTTANKSLAEQIGLIGTGIGSLFGGKK